MTLGLRVGTKLGKQVRNLGARFWRGNRGALAVELAIVAPIFVALIIGVAVVARAIDAQSDLNEAAKAAALVAVDAGAVTGNETKISQVAQTISGLPASDITVTGACECPNGTTISCASLCAGVKPRQYVTVAIAAPTSYAGYGAWMASYGSSLFPSGLNASVTARVPQ